MLYVSTRGAMEPRPFLEILMEGLAPDGGLVMPETIPRLSSADIARMRPMTYQELAVEIIGRFATDIPTPDLQHLVELTYTAEAFGSSEITPVTPLWENLHVLELSNGPSLAFKDVAMQFLGHLFAYVLDRSGEELNILGATSGDTGGAAIYAMRSKPHIRVVMLSPLGRTSAFQAAQMYSVLDPNIHNLALRGVFDDCQDIVKAIGEDSEFKARHHIGTVNSINWARVVAQTVYYFKAYFALTESHEERVSFAVPSGNFGNVYAGHVARTMGLPIERLVLATNENDVLDEFFRTGIYAPRSSNAVQATSSPSMDISKASNFERFVYDSVGGDAAVTRELYARLGTDGRFDLSSPEQRRLVSDSGLASGTSSHADRMSTIREVSERTGRVVDTHTADGIKVARHFAALSPDIPMICLETALPAKFADSIVEALGHQPRRPAAYEGLENREQRVLVIDNDVDAVRRFIAELSPS